MLVPFQKANKNLIVKISFTSITWKCTVIKTRTVLADSESHVGELVQILRGSMMIAVVFLHLHTSGKAVTVN